MYRQSKGIGAIAYPASTMASTRMYQGPRKQFLAEAAGAIVPGVCVVMGDDFAGRTVRAAVTATVNDPTALAGLYEGEGGTGADPTVLGLIGRAAVAKDLIWLTIHGVGKAVVQTTTLANASIRAPLGLRAATNDLTDAVAPVGGQSGIYLLDPVLTAGTQYAKNVWVRLT